MTKQANNQPSSATPEPDWQEEWVQLDAVTRHSPYQVRRKLDLEAVKRYRDRTEGGSVPPPIKVARIANVLYLIDGWHRVEAGALQTDMLHRGAVLALVASMSPQQARWEAARANMGHGVPLKTRDYRRVFQAFIKAKQHRKARGQLMSYREMAEAIGLGIAHTTLRNWTMQDFPPLFKALGGPEGGNHKAELQSPELPTLEQEHSEEAGKALSALAQHVKAMANPQSRWVVLQGLEALVATVQAAGVEQPEPEPF